MPHAEFLQDLVTIFGLSIGIILIFHRLHLPSMIGFLVSGAVLGPYGLNLIDDVEQVETLAEVGVVMLLFTIGMEFSLARLSRIRNFVLLGGGLQVGLTIALAASALAALQHPLRIGIFWGFLLALSSTAIVLKILMDRGELDSPHGRLSLGILIFQDLIVVPMMLLSPLLSGHLTQDPASVLFELGKSVLMIGSILVAARWAVPKALRLVVRARSRELFVISVILICLSIAWVASRSGLSLALGAFIAGLVISESEFSHQALADIIPFRDSFSSLFLISMGMLLDIRFFLNGPLLILAAAALVLLLKGAIAGGVTMALGYPLRVAVLVGLSLSQVGEFSFVLARAGQNLGLLSGDGYQLFLVISILSMIATPFLIRWGPALSRRAESLKGIPRWLSERELPDLEPQDLNVNNHVIIAGYGLNGRNLARVLKEVLIPYVILDINGETVRHARSQGEPIYFGDVTRIEVLKRLRIRDARVLVLALSDPFASLRAVEIARQASPGIHIVVRTRYVNDVDELLWLGADEVVPEEFETSLEIFDLVLQQYKIPKAQILQKQDELRKEGYAKLRRVEIEPDELEARLPEELQLERYRISETSALIGKSLSEIALPSKTGTLVVSIIRAGETRISPQGSFRLEAGDVLFLAGARDELDRARSCLEGNGSAESQET